PLRELLAVPEGPPPGVWEQSLAAVRRETELGSQAGSDDGRPSEEEGPAGAPVLEEPQDLEADEDVDLEAGYDPVPSALADALAEPVGTIQPDEARGDYHE